MPRTSTADQMIRLHNVAINNRMFPTIIFLYTSEYRIH